MRHTLKRRKCPSFRYNNIYSTPQTNKITIWHMTKPFEYITPFPLKDHLIHHDPILYARNGEKKVLWAMDSFLSNLQNRLCWSDHHRLHQTDRRVHAPANQVVTLLSFQGQFRNLNSFGSMTYLIIAQDSHGWHQWSTKLLQIHINSYSSSWMEEMAKWASQKVG